MASPASAVPLAAVGPLDEAIGFPFWFGDDGLGGVDPLRLELCLDDDPLCPTVEALPDPASPPSVPENFFEEAFWWSGEATIDTASGASALLSMAQEAAFGGPGGIAADQQIAFQRLRIRIDDAVPGATYTITSPYGVDEVRADDRGRVRMTDDSGCLAAPCDFTQALRGRIGPFLRWDEGAPVGYVGDPAIPHTVVGSPTGNNIFRVEGPGIGGPGVDTVETDLFTVQGRIARPQATVSLPGDLYAPGSSVKIISSFPGESDIVYTTDGTDPRDSATTTATTFPSTADDPSPSIALPSTDGTMTLKYVVRSDGQESELYEQVYEVRDGLSIVSAAPAPPDPQAAAGDPALRLEGLQTVTLTASFGGPIFYTTDGTRPRVDTAGLPVRSTRAYDESLGLLVSRSTTIKAIAAPTLLGAGPVSVFRYIVHNLRAVSDEKTYGYPFTVTDIGLPVGQDPVSLEPIREDAVELELCLDDPLCPVVGDLPDPTRGISFPANFPDESFWWAGEAALTAGNLDARLILGAEAAFASLTVQDGQQVAFGRIRTRINGAVPGATYEIVHPYGVFRATADDGGRVAYTDDDGCLSGPCDFTRLLTQSVGPFLRWDPNEGAAAPAGYVGDPNVEHSVIGSPYGTNEFVVTQVTDALGLPIAPQLIGSTDQFVVQGKLVGPGVMASWQTGEFNTPLTVELTGNSRTDEIRYTTDGSEPTATSPLYNNPIAIGEGTTVLSYRGFAAGGASSMVETETYTVDTTPPTMAASPAGGSFTAAQDVTLTANEPGSTVRYTLDGSTPTATSPVYAGPVRVAADLTLQAFAVDRVGNVGPVSSWAFTITNPVPPGGTGGTGGTPVEVPAVGLQLQQANPGPVLAGQRFALGGALTANGQPLVGVTVTLQSRLIGTTARLAPTGAWMDVATTTTASDGAYRFTELRPRTTTEFRVVYAGAGGSAPAVSPVRRLKVRAIVKLAKPRAAVTAGAKMTISGNLTPALRGQTVLVKLAGPGRHSQRVWAEVGRSGGWKIRLRAPQAQGRWTMVAVWRGDASLLRGVSDVKRFRVG